MWPFKKKRKKIDKRTCKLTRDGKRCYCKNKNGTVRFVGGELCEEIKEMRK